MRVLSILIALTIATGCGHKLVTAEAPVELATKSEVEKDLAAIEKENQGEDEKEKRASND